MAPYRLKDPSNCVFVERSCEQTHDRADAGYPDEWEFILRRKTNDGYVDEPIAYVRRANYDDRDVVKEYAKEVNRWIELNPSIPVEQQYVHHREGIRWDQRSTANWPPTTPPSAALDE